MAIHRTSKSKATYTVLEQAEMLSATWAAA
jgi:hypothetical protein